MTSSWTDRRPARRAARQGRRVLRLLRPSVRRQVRQARSWALEQAAALPTHTHAEHLVGLVTPPPAGLPDHAGPAVLAALEGTSATCLQRCLVLQSWLSAHGRPLEVAIGVQTTDGFKAHAWIPGFHGPAESEGYLEMARVPPGASGQLHATAP